MLADKRKKFLISLKLLGKSAPFHTKILIQIRALFGIRVLDLELGTIKCLINVGTQISVHPDLIPENL